MNELELTLLTNEERLTYEQNNDPRVAMLSWGQVHKLFSALIAARAESKRLRKIAEATQKAQDVLARWIVPDSNLNDTECLNALLGVLDTVELVEAQRALLQSEKESE